MRIQTFILCLLCCVASVSGKDIITKTDGSKLDVKVEEITETVIKYRKASNPTGPVYTIPLASVVTILYENGDKDTFTVPTSSSSINTTEFQSPSDEKLTHIEESQIYTHQNENVSDTQLFQMYNLKSASDALHAKAKKAKIIGWIGGCMWVAGGLTANIIMYNQNENSWYWGVFLPAGIAAGTIWCVGFNLWAKSLIKQAKQMELYSTTLIENEIIHFGDNSLTAGINLISNRITRSHTLAVSLGFNF